MGDKARKKKQAAKPKAKGLTTNVDSLSLGDSSLLDELRKLISQTQSNVARTVNSALVQMYWEVGTRIRTEVLKTSGRSTGNRFV